MAFHIPVGYSNHKLLGDKTLLVTFKHCITGHLHCSCWLSYWAAGYILMMVSLPPSLEAKSILLISCNKLFEMNPVPKSVFFRIHVSNT